MSIQNRISFRILLASAALLTSAGMASAQEQAPPAATAAAPVAPQQAQQEQFLTLFTTLHNTYLNNPTLRAAREQLRATHELLPQAQSGYKPAILADANVTRSDTDGSAAGRNGSVTSKGAGIILDQPLYRGGRTMASSAAARYTIEAQSNLLQAQEQDILLAAVTAYLNVVRDQALLELSMNNSDVISKNLEVTDKRFQVGELTKTDVSQAQARLARARSEIIRARGNLNTSKAVFSQVTGLPAEDLVEPIVELPLPVTLDDATAQAEQTNPLVLASTHVHDAAEKDIDNEFGSLLPEVGFFTSYGKTFDPSPGIGSDITDQAVGISATVPLYEAGATRSRVREAKHTANQRYLEILETRRQVRQDTVNSWENLQAAVSEIDSRAAEVEAASLAREGVRQETEIGTRSVLDTLDADQELLDAQVALVTAKTNRIIAEFALLSNIGYLTPATLGFGQDTIRHEKNLQDAQRAIFSTHVDRVGQGK